MNIYKRRPIFVHAYQWDGGEELVEGMIRGGAQITSRTDECYLLTASGPVRMAATDWVCVDKRGRRFRVDDFQFKREFKRASKSEAEASGM